MQVALGPQSAQFTGQLGPYPGFHDRKRVEVSERVVGGGLKWAKIGSIGSRLAKK